MNPIDFISAPGPMELVQGIGHVANKWKTWRAKKALGSAKLGRSSSQLERWLRRLYPELERPWGEESYPVTIFPSTAEQMESGDAVLGPLDKNPVHYDGSLAAAGQLYVDFLQQLAPPDKQPEDLPTYALKKLHTEGAIRLDCGMGSYFGALRTCDVLEWEILAFLEDAQVSSTLIEPALQKLKCRMLVHSSCQDQVRKPVGRSAAVAISTVVVFNRGKDYGVILQRRSETGVAVHGDLWHVAPSCMFQPIVGELQNEYSISHNVFREYLEELFQIPDQRGALSHDYFYGNKDLAFLRSLIDLGDAVLLFTGVAVNLLNLRPEICTVLHISSPEWFRKHKHGIEGVSPLTGLSDEFMNERSCVKDWKTIRRGFPLPEETVPPGAAALYLARRAIRMQSLQD